MVYAWGAELMVWVTRLFSFDSYRATKLKLWPALVGQYLQL